MDYKEKQNGVYLVPEPEGMVKITPGKNGKKDKRTGKITKFYDILCLHLEIIL